MFDFIKKKEKKVEKAYFSFSMLNHYLQKYYGSLEYAGIGMKTDWEEVHDDYIVDGEYVKTIPIHVKDQNVQGVYGSAWDKPIIKLIFKNGNEEEIRCIMGKDWQY